MPSIFVTGGTGYIGGDALYLLLEKHPELEASVTCLVRNSDRGAVIAKKYAKIKFVYGSLDDGDVLEKASAEADIVCHYADCDHEVAATAITTGLAKRALAGKPAYLIHTSGTGILTFSDAAAGRYGESSDKVFNDWDGVAEITSIPDTAWHRPVDKIVLAANDKKVKTAIVCPPTIYGPGRGQGNGRSVQWYKMAASAMKRGKGFHIGKGLNRWTYIHVHDLSELYLQLTESAMAGSSDDKIWGKEGYFFAEAGGYVWGDMAKNISKEAHKQGYLKTDDVDGINKDEAENLLEGGTNQWGLNSRCQAIRANKVFGWVPKGNSPEKELPGIIKGEAKVLRL